MGGKEHWMRHQDRRREIRARRATESHGKGGKGHQVRVLGPREEDRSRWMGRRIAPGMGASSVGTETGGERLELEGPQCRIGGRAIDCEHQVR